MTKICKHHGELSERNIIPVIRKHRNGKSTYKTSWCRLCRNEKQRKYWKNNPERGRNANLYTRFKLRRHEYDNLISEQGNKCAICFQHETYINKKLNAPNPLSVDHCHKTEKIRELLCQKCNTLLGMFQDSITILESAINYLRRHSTAE